MLTPEQSLYLAQRLIYTTPAAAADAAGVSLKDVEQWEQDPEFTARQSDVFEDHLAYAQQRSKVLLSEGVTQLHKALNAMKGKEPDWIARLKAVELLAKVTGLTDTKKREVPDIPQVLLDI